MRESDAVRLLGRIERRAHQRDQILKARRILQERSGLGYPSGNGPGRSSGHSDPVPRFVGRQDGFASDLAALHEQIEILDRASRTLDRIVEATLNVTVNAEQKGAAGCRICDLATRTNQQTRSSSPHPERWQPIHSHGLCSFCAGFLERYSCDPHPDITEYHLDHLGARIPLTLVRECHPVAFAQHHTPPSAHTPPPPTDSAAPPRQKPTPPLALTRLDYTEGRTSDG